MIEVRSKCPLCGHDKLQVEAFFNGINDSEYTEIMCKACGLKGVGDDDTEAYDDMIRRAPFQALDEALSAYLGVISVTLDDISKTVKDSHSQIRNILAGIVNGAGRLY